MELVGYIIAGLLMGLAGGLLGIGGSVVLVPALVLLFNKNQHLAQAAAMICNFFVAASATFSNKKAKTVIPAILKWMIPSGVLATIAGVILSDSKYFTAQSSIYLTRAFGIFMICVLIHNLYKVLRKPGKSSFEKENYETSPLNCIIIGAMTGFMAGLLGVGGGVFSTPLQQLFLGLPFRYAISNSSVVILVIAVFGATIKNFDLPVHGISVIESIRIAAMVIPSAILGAYIGANLMHKLPIKILRIAFIVLLAVVSYKMLTRIYHLIL